MAIARGTITTSLTATATTSTFSHTVSGVNPLLVLVATNLGATGSSLGGATYNGVSMTTLDDSFESVQTPRFSARFYYLVGPAAGAHDVVVTLNNGQDCACIAMTYNGVRQTGQPDARNEAVPLNGGSGSWTESITTIKDKSWVLMLAVTHFTGGLTGTGSANEAKKYQATVSLEDFFLYIYDTNAPKSPAGSVTMGAQENGTGNDAIYQLVSFSPTPFVPGQAMIL